MSKQQFRVSAYDAPAPRKVKPSLPGQIADGKLGVYRHDGALVGQVGPKATAATAGRFTKNPGMVLGKKDGRPAWVCDRNVTGGFGSIKGGKQ